MDQAPTRSFHLCRKRCTCEQNGSGVDFLSFLIDVWSPFGRVVILCWSCSGRFVCRSPIFSPRLLFSACLLFCVLCSVSLVLCFSLFLSLSLLTFDPFFFLLLCSCGSCSVCRARRSLAYFAAVPLQSAERGARSAAREATNEKTESPALGAHALVLAVSAALAAMASLAMLGTHITHVLPVQ